MDCELYIPELSAKEALRWIEALYGATVRPKPISDGIISVQLEAQEAVTITEKIEGEDILGIWFSMTPKGDMELASDAARFFTRKVLVSDESADPDSWIEVDRSSARPVRFEWRKKRLDQVPEPTSGLAPGRGPA